MVFYFDKAKGRTDEVAEKATVHVTLDQDFHVTKFDVELDSIPGGNIIGVEVTPTFDAINFDNNRTFYTDSNGLAMQKRLLNHRDYYDYDLEWVDPHHLGHN